MTDPMPILLHCPRCGYEMAAPPGWAFKVRHAVKCEGHPGEVPREAEAFRHPFHRVDPAE